MFSNCWPFTTFSWFCGPWHVKWHVRVKFWPEQTFCPPLKLMLVWQPPKRNNYRHVALQIHKKSYYVPFPKLTSYIWWNQQQQNEFQKAHVWTELRPTVEVQVEIDFAESNSHVMNKRTLLRLWLCILSADDQLDICSNNKNPSNQNNFHVWMKRSSKWNITCNGSANLVAPHHINVNKKVLDVRIKTSQCFLLFQS